MKEVLDRSAVIDALYDAGLDEEALYEKYSGRCMYGEECVGIVGSISDVMAFVTSLAIRVTVEFETTGETSLTPANVRQMATDVRLDDMGRQAIAYFPGWLLGEEE